MCGYVLMKDAPGKLDQAYDFLNAVNAPDVSNYMVTTFGYGHGNSARAWRRSTTRCWPSAAIDDVDKFLDKTLFQQPVRAGAEAAHDRRVREDQGRLLSEQAAKNRRRHRRRRLHRPVGGA